jgi:ubiquinone/menaquinone biosynthesis C-methylase UbiE
VNCDKYNARADVHCDCSNLPYEAGQVDELCAIHLLEHFHRMDAERALREWHRVLKPGGKLVMELPSLDKITTFLTAGEPNLRLTLYGLYGDPSETKPGMQHQWAWSARELEMVLQGVGFRAISFGEAKFHVPVRDQRVEAVK